MPDRTLGQIIAVEKATRQKDNTEGSRIQNALVRQGAVTGSTKTYQPMDANAPESERPAPKYMAVRATVPDALREARQYSVPAMDVTATKDATNQAAVADLNVEGLTLVPAVPISHLLWLENYLTEWKKFLAKLPTLDPTIRWHWDEAQQLYVSEPVNDWRNLKETVPLMLAPATKEHQAQVTTTVKETPVGMFTTVATSGAISDHRKQQLMDKIDKMSLAVKDAVSRANKTPAIEVREGDTIMDFLLS
jgi:hypothetical protein